MISKDRYLWNGYLADRYLCFGIGTLQIGTSGNRYLVLAPPETGLAGGKIRMSSSVVKGPPLEVGSLYALGLLVHVSCQ
jgi:hypothetical protein